MIQSLALVAFRGHTKSFTFGPRLNALKGPNEIGKSTIAEAIAFAWFGTDTSGTKNPDHLISEGSIVCEVSLTTEHVTVTRKKSRGKTSTLKLARSGLPPVQMTQTELSQLMKITPEAFMSCWLATYFMDRLSPEKQLSVLAELSQVDRRSLLQSMLGEGFPIPAKLKLQNPRIDADAVAGERRQLQNMVASDEGALSQLEAQVAQLKEGASIDLDSYEKTLNEINARLDAFDFYNKALSQYGIERMRFGEAINRKGACEAGLMSLPFKTEEDILHLASEIRQLADKGLLQSQKILELKGQIKPQLAAPKKPKPMLTNSECESCGQIIGLDHVAHVMSGYEKALLEYNEEARKIESFNQSIQEQIQKAEEIQRESHIEHSNKTMEYQRFIEINKASAKRKAELEKELAELGKLKDPVAPVKPQGDEGALRKELLEVNTAVVTAKKSAEQLKSLESQRELLLGSISKRRTQISALSALESALKSLPGKETEMLLQSLQVPGIRVGLQDGALSVANEKGIPYQSLSSGKRMKTGLAFCQSFRGIAGRRAPSWVFLDNADLVDFITFPEGTQWFVAEVDPLLKDLTIISD